jgi:hypothetical protein
MVSSTHSFQDPPNQMPVGDDSFPLKSALREFSYSKSRTKCLYECYVAVINAFPPWRASVNKQSDMARAEISDPPVKLSHRLRIPGLSKLPRLITSPLHRKSPRVKATPLPHTDTLSPTYLPNPVSRPTSGRSGETSNASYPLHLSLPRAFPLDGIADVENAFERPRPVPRII